MPLHREPRLVSMSGWSSDFAPLSSAFSSLCGTMAWLLKSHNGVHCCGTVGDSHSHSQLSTATCTSQGGHLCFRSALQRYNIPPNPPNKSWKKISVICHDCHDRSIMLKKLSATRGSKIFHTWSQIDISNLSARQVTDIS